jgi:hypothetical protein
LREVGGIGRQHPGGVIQQQNPGLLRVDVPEMPFQRVVGDLAQRAG